MAGAPDQLPHAPEAERAILGTVLLHPEALASAEAIPASGAPFYAPSHQKIWRAIHAVAVSGGTPELTAVAVALRQAGEGELIPLASSCTDSAAGASSIGWYVRLVLDAWRKRDAIKSLDAIHSEAKNGATPAQLSQMADVLSLSLKDAVGERALHTIGLGHVLREEPPPISWLVDGWLAEGDGAIFAGEWGTGKSLAALDLALALATGARWMGIADCRSVPVVYCDEENNPRNIARRMRQLATGRGILPEQADSLPITYLARNGIRLDDESSALAIHRLIERTRARVLVLDSLIRFARMDENSNSEAAQFFDLRVKPIMARHDCAVVMLDHMRKPAANKKTDSDPGHRIRGASDKPGFVDELWTLEGDRASHNRTLRHEKARTDHPQSALALRWEVSDDETAASIIAVEEQVGSEAIVLSTLSEAGQDGCLRSDLMDAMMQRGFPERTANRTLGKLHGQGTIRKASAGNRTVRYWLASF